MRGVCAATTLKAQVTIDIIINTIKIDIVILYRAVMTNRLALMRLPLLLQRLVCAGHELQVF